MNRTTRTSRFVQNSVSTAMYQLTAMFMGFVTPRLMMRFYGSQVNGLVVSVLEFLTYFRLVEAGLASASIFSLYKPLADRDHHSISAIVTAARRYYHTVGFIFAGITVVFSAIYPLFVPIETMSPFSVMLLIMAMGISSSLEFFTLARYRVLLMADQRTFMVSLASMVTLVISTVLIIVCSYLRVDVIIMRFFASATIVLRSAILSAYVKKHYPAVTSFYPKPNKEALSRRWDAMYHQCAEAFQQGAGIMLTTVITRDAAMVSVYGAYHMVTVGLLGILKMTTTGIASGFGNLLMSGEERLFHAAYRDYEYLYLAITTALFACAAVLIVPFVVLYTSHIKDANYFVPLIGMMIVIEAITHHGTIPMESMIFASGKFRETRHHCTAQLVSAVLLGLGLGIWGMQTSAPMAVCGILGGIILSNILRILLYIGFVPKHIPCLSARKSVARLVRMLAEAAVIAVPTLFIFPLDPLRVDSYLKWFAVAVPLLLYALALTVAFGWLFERESLLSLIGRARYMLRSGK